MEIQKLNFREFYHKYNPITNTFVKDAKCDGHLFEGADMIKDAPLNYVWTLIYDQVADDMYIVNDKRVINNMGYLVATKPYTKEEMIEVRLDETDYKQEDNE